MEIIRQFNTDNKPKYLSKTNIRLPLKIYNKKKSDDTPQN